MENDSLRKRDILLVFSFVAKGYLYVISVLYALEGVAIVSGSYSSLTMLLIPFFLPAAFLLVVPDRAFIRNYLPLGTGVVELGIGFVEVVLGLLGFLCLRYLRRFSRLIYVWYGLSFLALMVIVNQEKSNIFGQIETCLYFLATVLVHIGNKNNPSEQEMPPENDPPRPLGLGI
jgi:hypothetical protein